MASELNREPTLADVLDRLDRFGDNVEQLSGDVERLSGDVERLSGDVQRISSDVERLSGDVQRISGDVEASNARFEKWDGRLWGLTLGLIGTAWTAIFAASAVVITRTLYGQ